MSEKEEEWIFTFCQDSPHRNAYVAIKGTYTKARKEMFERFGDKWAFQYENKKQAGVDIFNLYELK